MTIREGAVARAREDAANGSSHFIAGQARVDSSAQHVVSKALRRSIADAYAAYVGQVNGVPLDNYGLALYALEKTYPVGLPSGTTTGRHSFNLTASPFCTSKAKHAAIGNAARQILQNLDAYVHEVAALAPGDLDRLQQRLPVFDDKGNEIYWDPATAAHVALHGTKGRQQHAAPNHNESRDKQQDPYPPQHRMSAGHEAASSTSPPPKQAVRRALAGTAHRPSLPSSRHAASNSSSPTRVAERRGGEGGQGGRVGRAAGRTSTSPMLNRGEGQGTEESTDRSRDGGRVSSSSVQKGEHSRASWQMREQGAWGEEATCAQAAVRVVSSASAEALREKDPVAQQQQRNAQALLAGNVQKKQQQQNVLALVRAQLPAAYACLPPHLRVSDYYSHVRPPGPLHDFHVSLLPHTRTASQISPPPKRSHSPPPRNHSQQQPSQVPFQQQQQQQQQAHTEAGTHTDAAQGCAAGTEQGRQACIDDANCVARSLGFADISDAQLLEIIKVLKQVQFAAATAVSGSEASTSPALPGTGIFNACNANRSRRLAPTNVQLHRMRTSMHQHVSETGAEQQQQQHTGEEHDNEKDTGAAQAPAEKSRQQQQQEEKFNHSINTDNVVNPNRSRRLAPH